MDYMTRSGQPPAAWPSRAEWAAGAERWVRETFDPERRVPADDPSRSLTPAEDAEVAAEVERIHRMLRAALTGRIRELRDGGAFAATVEDAAAVRRLLGQAMRARDWVRFAEQVRAAERVLPGVPGGHDELLWRIERVLAGRRARFRAAVGRELAGAIAREVARRASDEGWEAELERRRLVDDYARGAAGLRPAGGVR